MCFVVILHLLWDTDSPNCEKFSTCIGILKEIYKSILKHIIKMSWKSHCLMLVMHAYRDRKLPTLSAVYGLKSEIQFYTHKQHENAKIGDTWCQYLSSQKSIIPDLAARRAAWNQYLWLGEETAEWEDLRVELLLNLSVWGRFELFKKRPFWVPRLKMIPDITVWVETERQRPLRCTWDGLVALKKQL